MHLPLKDAYSVEIERVEDLSLALPHYRLTIGNLFDSESLLFLADEAGLTAALRCATDVYNRMFKGRTSPLDPSDYGAKKEKR